MNKKMELSRTIISECQQIMLKFVVLSILFVAEMEKLAAEALASEPQRKLGRSVHHTS
jgi:hypothetical protein